MQLVQSQKIEMIFFDAAGTLFDLREPVGETYARFARDFHQQIDPNELQRQFFSCFPRQPEMAFAPQLTRLERERLERKWWENLVRMVWGEHWVGPAFQTYFDQVFDHYASAQAWVVDPAVQLVLTTLKMRGYRLGMISNFDTRLYALLKAFNLTPLLDRVYLSSEVGVAKPNAGIFQFALSENQVEASAAMHVGDSWNDDVQGARQAGLVPVWLTSKSEALAASETFVIRNLQELAAIL